jgi:hypothetical protein
MAAEKASGDGTLTVRANSLCRALGYAGRPTFYDSYAAFDRTENRNLVRSAFEVLGVHAVFGIADGASPESFKPLAYIACAEDAAAADRFHRRAWTQSAAPVLLVVRADTIEIRNGFAPPAKRIVGHPYRTDAPLDPALSKVDATALCTSLHWRDLPIGRSSPIDQRLVSAIDRLAAYACRNYEGFADRRPLVNALIGRLIYLYVLVDRGIVDRAWMAATITAAGCAGTSFADDAVLHGVRNRDEEFDVAEVWAVLRGIDRRINGSIFPITKRERAEIPDGLVRLAHRIIRCGDRISIGGRQLSFLDVSFEMLRTETISSIYEHFVRSGNVTDQRSAGAYYTPPFLVDYVIRETARERTIDANSRVLDCAAGSGAFLVAAYRWILERSAPPGGWTPAHAPLARTLLVDCIHGIEKNPQAANVCRFSLYLTMLDYVGGAGIDELADNVEHGKLFPRLGRNIKAANAFKLGLFSEASFTHVVGNPPWAQPNRQPNARNRGASANRTEGDTPPPEIAEDPDRTAFEGTLGPAEGMANGRLSDAFTWLALRRYLAGSGVLSFVLPTRSLVGRQSGAFATSLAAQACVRHIANLSHLRYHLFSGAKSPATVVVARRAPAHPFDLVIVYRPRLSSLPIYRTGDRMGNVWSLLVSQTDLHTVRSLDLRSGPNGWLGPIMFGPFDRRMRDALALLARDSERTFGDLLKRSGLQIRRGGDPDETGVPEQFAPGTAVSGPTGAKPLGLFPLDRERFLGVKPVYRPIFSAGAILVPRTFREVRLLDGPHAFRSTYDAIAPARGRDEDIVDDEEKWARASTTASGTRRAGLLGVVAFLRTGVASYFASLFGASLHLEDARFEKGDLVTIPCPFRDLDDPGLWALADASDPDRAVLDAMNAGADLRTAVADHVRFNVGFLDAQMPQDAFAKVDGTMVDEFVERFERELRSLFTTAFQPRISVEAPERGTIRLIVTLGEGGRDARPDPIESDGSFIASSVIAFDRHRRSGTVVKSEGRFAWTADQAVADAEAMARVVRTTRA